MSEKLSELNLSHIQITKKKNLFRSSSLFSSDNNFKDKGSQSFSIPKPVTEQNKWENNIFEEKYTHKLKNNYSNFRIKTINFHYPNHIENIIQEIKNSTFILGLEPNWDDEGATVVNFATWKTAVTFLFNYSLYIFNDSKKTIHEPDIAPVNDGSIDLTWRTEKARLLINIKPGSLEKADYYGDLYSNIDCSKGSVSTSTINESFIGWIKFFKIA